jgi:hypothetical protein
MKKVYWIWIAFVFIFLFFVQEAFAARLSKFDIICNIDFDFLEKNICSNSSCLFQINKIDNNSYFIGYVTKDLDNHFNTNMGFISLGFNVNLNSNNYSILSPIERSDSTSFDFIYLNESRVDFLNKVCKEDISPVIKRMKEDSLPCCFYFETFCECAFAKYSAEIENKYKNEGYTVDKFDDWMVLYEPPLGGGGILSIVLFGLIFILTLLINPVILLIIILTIVIFLIKKKSNKKPKKQ